MIRRLRAWWATQKHPYRSAEYVAAMEVLQPGYLAREAEADARHREWRRREAEWFDSLVALQRAGRIEEAERQAMADQQAGRLSFVNEFMERLAELYALEVDRLLAAGDRGGAAVAADHAWSLLQQWASWSTSGGEGTARSRAAEDMRRALEAKLAAAAAGAAGA